MKRLQLPPALLLIPCVTLLSACAVPLGPGYTVKRQQLAAQWTGTPELAVRGTYRLQNTGKVPLDYIEVTLPPDSRRSGLQIALDNSPVATQSADPLAPEGTVRIPIHPPLPIKKKRDLVIEYRLAGSVADVSATPSFYLETRGWYPVLRAREGLFGSGGDPPEKWDLRVTVPRDFLVHASGQPKGRKRRGDAVEHRFRQRTDRDFFPFAMAGELSEYRVDIAGRELVLWSRDALTPEKAKQTLERIRSIVEGLQSAFGPLDEQGKALVFAQGGVATSSGQSEAVTFPYGVWINWPLFDEPHSCEVDAAAARLWFFHLARPDSEAEELALTFTNHAPALSAGGCERRLPSFEPATFVEQTLRAYERDRKEFDREPGEHVKRGMQLSKLSLFLVALEERLGRGVLNASLKRMLQALRGRTWTTNDLRVAIHLETGEDPAEFFRLWLNQPGIPDEFRKKYETQVPGSR